LLHFQVSIQDMEYFVAAMPAGDDGGQQSGGQQSEGQQSEGHQADREGPDREEPKRHALCFHKGAPKLVDLLEMAPWEAWTTSLLRWAKRKSSIAGCMAITDGEVVQASSDWREDSSPTCNILRALADAGWQRGPAPLVHDQVATRVFDTKDPIASKDYLRCLLKLAAGQLDQLRSDQPAKYYTCVLASSDPSKVRLGQDPAFYKGMLRRGVDDQLGASTDDDDVAAIADADTGSNSGQDQPMLSMGGQQKKRKKVSMGGQQKKRKKVAGSSNDVAGSSNDWATLVWGAEQPPLCVADGATPLCIVDGPADAGSGGASSSGELLVPTLLSNTAAVQQEPAVPDAGSSGGASSSGQPLVPAPLLSAEQGQGQRESQREGQRELIVLEGSQLSEERHGVLGQSGAYRRLRTQCSAHKNCDRSRAFSKRFGKLSGLGDFEPYAFLGCWLQHRTKCEDAAAHKAWSPEVEDVIAYAKTLQ